MTFGPLANLAPGTATIQQRLASEQPEVDFAVVADLHPNGRNAR